LFPQVEHDGSDYTFGDADVRIGDMKTTLFNVFQTLVGIRWYPPPPLAFHPGSGNIGRLNAYNQQVRLLPPDPLVVSNCGCKAFKKTASCRAPGHGQFALRKLLS
jgi:hypothetical protein